MKKTDLMLGEAIKAILVKMTIECTLPSDMNQLNMPKVLETAMFNLKKNDEFIREKQIKNFSECTSYDDYDELIEAYNRLEAMSDDNDYDLADDHFCMWEKFENEFTIAQLWEEIEL